MKKITISLFITLLSVAAHSQLDAQKIKAIDSLFISWNQPNHPGGAIGIVQKGELVYSKAFGLASLEYLVPNTTGTRFNIASISKQFTAMAIVKLQLEGKLSVDDDIRKYLTELPDFGHTVTFRHMLHHTSGMRSLHMMLALAGWRGDDSRTNEDLLRFMKKQQELNFVPGAEYMYCNTGYILMAIVVEKLTGVNFADYMKKEIFVPLGMYETYVEDRYNRVVPNNATSYQGTATREFEREVEYWGYTGSGNIHSTTDNLLNWFRYFYLPPEGWEKAFEMMLTVDPFNDGKPNNYAFGVIVDNNRDEKRISHSGSIGGFRAFACTYPESQIEIAVLTNFSSSDINRKVNIISDILFERSPEKRPEFKLEEVIMDDFVPEDYTGTFQIEDMPNRRFEILINENNLFYKFTGQSNIRLAASDKNILFNNNSQTKITFDPSDQDTIELFTNGRNYKGIKTMKYVPDEEELTSIAGTYWSPELDTYYNFSLKEGKLTGYHTRHGEFTAECLEKDLYVSDSGFISRISIVRDKKGRVTGMKGSNSRVRDLRMEKR